MKKIKYYFNPKTLRFEKVETPLNKRLLYIVGFIFASLFSGFLMIVIMFNYIDSPKEKLLRRENIVYKQNYFILKERIRLLELQMDEIENRDNNIYKSIFEGTPVPDSARIKEMENNKEIRLVENLSESELTKGLSTQINNLLYRISFQNNSFDELAVLVKDKQKLINAIPSIQPINNKQLNKISGKFGYRIDPFNKIQKLHEGIDFSASTGTPIYATAAGKVVFAGFKSDGYGIKVVINHGFGYESLYGHMVRNKVTEGATVKKGEVIGYVGSTGRSTAPHLHYEVMRRNTKVDPINYFFNDLTTEQYDRILKIAANNKQSFD